ncbi:MAG: hypothetical protein H6Q03_964 [Acidobacteria bacterium]|nr:hypothetical protein [Acidobacteriota bacterium]
MASAREESSAAPVRAGGGPSARLRAAVPSLSVLALGLALVLPYLGGLGLWNDDVLQFLQPHHAARGDALGYVLDDTTGFLAGGERPAAWLAYAVARLAYLAGVPWLHLFAVLCAAGAAALFARFCRHLFADAGAALVAGALVLLWPLSPLVLFWPSALHFPAAAGLSILAAEAALAARRRAPVLATALHLLACLTLEVFLLAAPALTLAALASERLGLVRRRATAAGSRRRALAGMLGASAAVLLWRLWLLPGLGLERLYYELQLPTPAAALAHAAEIPRAVLWPWSRALPLARGISPAPLPWAAALGLAAVLAGTAFALGARRAAAATSGAPARTAWAWAPGAGLLALWAAQLAFVPGSFADPVGLSSRLAYPALYGVAAALAGGCAALSAAPGRWRLPARALAHALLFLAAAAGVRFEQRVLRAHVQDWRTTGIRLAQIAALCPAPQPGTVFVLDTPWPTTLLRTGQSGMSHPVVSSLLIARFDDPTLRGARRAELRSVPNGLRSLDFRKPSRWFRDGDYGTVQTRARALAAPVAPGRLVTLAPRPAPYGALARVPTLRVAIDRDRHRILRDRPERCGPAAVPPSPAFCHAFPGICRDALAARGGQPGEGAVRTPSGR